MASKSKKKKKKTAAQSKKSSELNPLLYEVIGLAMIGLAIILIFEFGIVGRSLSSLSRFLLGNWHSAIPLLLIVQALMFMIKRKMGGWKNRIVGGCLFLLASLVLFSHVYLFKELYESRVLMSDSALKETWKILITNDGIASRNGALGGGMVGAILFAMFHSLFDSAGAMVAGVLLFLIGFILLTGKALVPYVAEHFPQFWDGMKGMFVKKEQQKTKTAPKTRATRSKKTRETAVDRYRRQSR